MNGPEHYRKAERLVDTLDDLLTLVAEEPDGSPHIPGGLAAINATMAAAQVHATLALTAATAQGAADPAIRRFPATEVWDEWLETLS